jgi:hypothetical protein
MKDLLPLLSLRRAFWLWFGGIWLFVGLVFLPVGIFVGLNERRFDQQGTVVTGMVLTKGFDPASSDNESTDYWITYRFTTPDGHVIEGRDTVGVHLWESLEERGPVELQYLPSQPGKNRVRRSSEWFLPLIFLGFSAVFVPVGGVLFAKGARDVYREWGLLHHGVETKGRITRIEDALATVNDVQQRQVGYSYSTEDGQQYDGTSDPMSPEEAATWSVGDTGLVRYSPGQPSRSVWIGRAEQPSGTEPVET